MLVELATIERIDKHTQSTFKRIRATREAARRSGQTSQIMSQLSVIAFDREGIGFAFRDFISAPVIPQAIVGIKGITVIAFGLGCRIHHILDGLLGAFPNYFPAQITARPPVYAREDVDPVFLLPIKVNNSSISAVLTSLGTGASGMFAAPAWTHNDTVR